MYFRIFLVVPFSAFSLIFLVPCFFIFFQSLEFHIYIYYIPDTLLSYMSKFACYFPHLSFLDCFTDSFFSFSSFNCLSFFINRHIFFLGICMSVTLLTVALFKCIFNGILGIGKALNFYKLHLKYKDSRSAL